MSSEVPVSRLFNFARGGKKQNFPAEISVLQLIAKPIIHIHGKIPHILP
jgi:hypothetical protein